MTRPPGPIRPGQLEVLTGSKAGTLILLDGPSLIVGRSAGSDLQFDPQSELAVSAQHALLSFQSGEWFLSDLGSLNGTLLNGRKVSVMVPLGDEDRIQFGEDGPTVLFRVAQGGGTPGGPRKASHQKHFLVLSVLLSIALVVVGSVALRSWINGRRYAEQVRAMETQIDSILSESEEAVDQLRGSNQSLAEALTKSRADIQGFRAELEEARGSGDQGQVEALRVQLQEAQTALTRQQLAAAIDFQAIEEESRRAVAKVFVDFGDEVTSATAFAVRPNGVLLTNRHVVAGASGNRRAVRIAVQFADSRQIWPARVVAVSQEDDLAAIKVDNIVGDVPTISGFNNRPDTVSSGQAVAVIGFPLGGANPYGEGEDQLARTTLTAGIISAMRGDALEVNGYGVEGSSGSPIFDSSGEVVGVLYGGRINAGERTLFAVLATRATELLERVR